MSPTPSGPCSRSADDRVVDPARRDDEDHPILVGRGELVPRGLQNRFPVSPGDDHHERPAGETVTQPLQRLPPGLYLSGQQQSEHRGADPALGGQVFPAVLDDERQQRPRGVDHGVRDRGEGPLEADGEEPPDPAGTERLHDDVFQRRGERQARGRAPAPGLPQAPQLGEEAVGGEGRALACRMPYGSRLVEQERPATELAGKTVDHRLRPLGAEGRTGETALSREGVADLLVLLGGDQVADQLADRDERGVPRHLDQWQPGPRRGVLQRVRDLLVPEADAEAKPGDPLADQPVDVGRGVAGAEAHARGEDQLAALQERGRVLQLADRHPAHRPVERVLSREHAELERQAPHDRAERRCHDHPPFVRYGQCVTCNFAIAQHRHTGMRDIPSHHEHRSSRAAPRFLRSAASSPRFPARSRASCSRASRPPSHPASAPRCRSS